MSDTIGSLAYKVKFDASQLTHGLMSTRQQLSAARKMTESMQSPLEKYRFGLENVDSMVRKGLISINDHTQASQQLRRQYLETEASVRRLTDAEKQELQTLKNLSATVRTTAEDERKRSAQMARGRDIIEQNRSAQDKLNRSLVEARQLYRSGAIDAQTYQRHTSQLKKDSGLGGMSLVRAPLKAAGAIAAGFVGLSTIKDSINIHADVERSTAAMEAFTGSAARAASIIDQIRKLSSQSGIGFRALSEGASAMLSYGVTVDDTSKKMRQFAEISRGDTERFRSLALAFGQVNAAGRLMGQEVLQMVNAGFNPLQEIARTTGIEFATLKKMLEGGEVSIGMVSKAFDTATSAGGRFNGMMEKIGETSSGALGRMSADWDILRDKIGGALEPLTRFGSEGLSSLMRNTAAMLSEPTDAAGQYMGLSKQEMKGAENTVGATPLQEAAFESNRLDELFKSKHGNKIAQWEQERLAGIEKRKQSETAKQQEQERIKANNVAAMQKAQEMRTAAANGLQSQDQKSDRTQSSMDESARAKGVAQGSKQSAAQPAAPMLTRAQHEATSYPNQSAAFAAEMALQRQEAMARMQAMQKVMPEAKQEMARRQFSAQSPRQAYKGSSEAYQVIAGAQVRHNNQLLKESQKQVAAVNKQVAATNKTNELLKNIGDNLNFESVGS